MAVPQNCPGNRQPKPTTCDLWNTTRGGRWSTKRRLLASGDWDSLGLTPWGWWVFQGVTWRDQISPFLVSRCFEKRGNQADPPFGGGKTLSIFCYKTTYPSPLLGWSFPRKWDCCWATPFGFVKHMGVSNNRGETPVKIMENPMKLDDLGGKPTIFGNIHILWFPGLFQVVFAFREKNMLQGTNTHIPTTCIRETREKSIIFKKWRLEEGISSEFTGRVWSCQIGWINFDPIFPYFFWDGLSADPGKIDNPPTIFGSNLCMASWIYHPEDAESISSKNGTFVEFLLQKLSRIDRIDFWLRIAS